MAGQLLGCRGLDGQPFAQGVLGVVCRAAEHAVSPVPPAPVAADVDHGVHEQAPAPRGDACRVAELVEPLAPNQLAEGDMHRVLELVAEAGVSLMCDREPLSAEGRKHLRQTRIGRIRGGRAQNRHDLLRRADRKHPSSMRAAPVGVKKPGSWSVTHQRPPERLSVSGMCVPCVRSPSTVCWTAI